jgi:HAD superfamily hydrolase (TIGR01509 family)
VKVELLIFDCDGVLVDSEIVGHQVGVDEIVRLGGSTTVEESIKTFTGFTDEEIDRLLKEKHGEKISDNFLQGLKNKINVCYQDTLQSVANIHSVMQYLVDKKMPRCIASNSMSGHLQSVLNLTKLDGYFKSEHIYNASMVKQGKPAPDLFLHAADQMQVKPKNCLVIEDSTIGIAAAKAAKIPVIGFLGGTHAKYLWYKDGIKKAQPLEVVDDAYALLNLLKKLVE